MSRGYKDLKVWQFAMDLAERVYEVTRGYPAEERYGLTSQMRRAAVSVPSNIAEGQGRGGKEFCHFIDIAYGSLLELETQIELSTRLRYITETDAKGLLDQSAEVGKMLNGLKNSLGKHRKTDD